MKQWHTLVDVDYNTDTKGSLAFGMLPMLAWHIIQILKCFLDTMHRAI